MNKGLLVCGWALACSSGEGKTAFFGATVIDGSGGPPIASAVILVDGGHIEAIGPEGAVAVPRGTERVSLEGRWVMPGLIDMHARAAPWMLSRFLAYGVTSVRDAGSPAPAIFTLRDDVLIGNAIGPRLYVGGAPIDRSPGSLPWATAVGTADEARRAIDQIVLLDASHASVFTGIDERLLRPLMDEARTLKLPVAARLGKVDAVTAGRMGVRMLEHMSGVVEAAVAAPRLFFDAHDDPHVGWKTFERGWAAVDSAAMERVAVALVQAGTAIIPTLALHETYSRLTDELFLAGLDLAGVPDSVRRTWDVPAVLQRARISAADFEAFARSRPVQDQFVRTFDRAGGLVGAGSGTPGEFLAPGASLHDELAALVRAGLTPQRALLSATRDAARIMVVDSIGQLREGAVADFVVLTRDPLRDIANARAIETVVLRGVPRRASELRGTWN